jgi:hypothetical protein
MRDHIEFVQAQRLDWRDGAACGRPGTRLKLLSEDADTGAVSCIASCPACWSAADGVLAVDEEIYILDGSLTISGTTYREDGYAFLPAGYARTNVGSPEGVTFLSFLSGPIGPGSAAQFDPRRLVQVDLTEGAWEGDFAKFGLDAMKARARMRVLRDDPLTGENTYITATTPFMAGKGAERHPVVQEFYLLWGELAGNTGIMQAGAYCFRPPMVKHAPYGSRSGAVILFRSLGGRQETFWEDAPPFTFTPEHAPFLPDHLKPLGTPYPRPPRY